MRAPGDPVRARTGEEEIVAQETELLRKDFNRLVNMTPDEMRSHFSSEASDFVSLEPRVAKALKLKSGKELGKKALTLKEKDEWDEAETKAASNIVNKLKWQLGRLARGNVKIANEDGEPTPFAVSLMNRGHDPAKVAESDSVMDYTRAIRKALDERLRAQFGGEYPDGVYEPWVNDDRIFPTEGYFVFEWEGNLFRFDYEYIDGVVTLSDSMLAVEEAFITAEPSVDSPIVGQLVEVQESAEGTNKVPVWKAFMLKAGQAINVAKNGKRRIYSEEAVKEAVEAGLFDNIPGMLRTDSQHQAEAPTLVAGMWQKASYDELHKGVLNTFIYNPESYPALIHENIVESLKKGDKTSLPGFSFTGRVQNDDPPNNHIVRKITAVRSCDPISFPSAGGEIVSVQESKKRIPKQKSGAAAMKRNSKAKNTEDVQEGAAAEFMLAQLMKARPKMFEKMPDLESKLSGEEGEVLLVTLYTEFLEAQGIETPDVSGEDEGEAIAEGIASLIEKHSGNAPAKKPAEKAPVKKNEPVREGVVPSDLINELGQQALEGIIRSSGLNEIEAQEIRESFAGKNFSVDDVRESVRRAQDRQTKYGQHRPDTRLVVTEDWKDKAQRAVNDFFHVAEKDVTVRESINATHGNGIDLLSKNTRGGINSIKELYIFLTGDEKLSLTNEAVREGIDPTMVTNIINAGIQLRVSSLYPVHTLYDDWKLLANIIPVSDFKSQEVMVTGHYSALQKVLKGDAYQEITQGSPMKQTYIAETYGGLVTIHRKDIINDKTGEIQRLPDKVVAGAKIDNAEIAWSLILDNPTMGDGVALFHSTHANLLSGAYGLSTTNLPLLDEKLMLQTYPGRNSKLLLGTKYVIIPANNTMKTAAYNTLTQAANQNNMVPVFTQSWNAQAIICPFATDANDYYVVADKALVDILEFGYYGGNEEPEILVADTQVAGTLFTHDQIQYKVRHEYGGNVVDFRPLAKASVT